MAADATRRPSKRRRHDEAPQEAGQVTVIDTTRTNEDGEPAVLKEAREGGETEQQHVVEQSADEPANAVKLSEWLVEAMVVPSALDQGPPLEEVTGLSEALHPALRAAGISRLFPVQAAAVQTLLAESDMLSHPGDVCVAAPTGSGKTLTYVIPVVQTLATRTVVRLRALVLLPTRELVSQVFGVFSQVAANTDLRIAMVTGQQSFAQEQRALVDEQVLQRDAAAPYGGASRVDIVIATPGRLVDHLASTPGFTLQHLRFLVIDEADRLLGQAYQHWLPRVVSAAEDSAAEPTAWPPCAPDAQTLRPSSWHPLLHPPCRTPLQKLLVSATLTRNPGKIAGLRLFRPRYFTVDTALQKRYALPDSLKEYLCVTEVQHKPVVLLHLLLVEKIGQTVCFTSSVEATHRLFRLLQLHGGLRVAEFSGNLSGAERAAILESFVAGKVQLYDSLRPRANTFPLAHLQPVPDSLVCSDGMARGLDLENIANVVNYDAPVFIKTYVHRVGRTARAGRPGAAYTICTPNEVRHFKELHAKTSRAAINNYRVRDPDIDAQLPRYQAALERLKDVLLAEKRGQLQLQQPVDPVE